MLETIQEFVKVYTKVGLDSDIEEAVGDFFTSVSEGAVGNKVRRLVHKDSQGWCD